MRGFRGKCSFLGSRVLFAGAAIVALSFQSAVYAADAPFAQQWALKNTGQKVCDLSGACQTGTAGVDIKAQDAWKVQHDCQNVIAAVLDTGVDYTHPDLKGNLLQGANFTGSTQTSDPMDDNLHGTHVTGTIAGNGNETGGVAGICATAKVLPVKVATGDGTLADSDIIEGVSYAAKMGARTLNASFGGGGKSKAMEDAIAKASNTLFLIAAGNGSPWTGKGFDIDKTPVYPASYAQPNIVVVAATDNRDVLGSFSNWGKKTVALAAPGVAILSTVPVVQTDEQKNNGIPAKYAYLDGTSMATPHVTGAATLALAQNPSMTTAQLKAKLLSGVDALSNLSAKTITGGRLNLAKLVGASSSVKPNAPGPRSRR